MRKYVYFLITVVASVVICGLIGWSNFVGYGGRNCDVDNKNCDCFCCNLFGLRGYEACGDFGIYIGVGFGLIIGVLLYILFIKFIYSKKINK